MTAGDATAAAPYPASPLDTAAERAEQWLRCPTAKSRISLQTWCHQRSEVMYSWWGTDTQPLSMTLLRGRAERTSNPGMAESSAAACKGARVSESFGRCCCQHGELKRGAQRLQHRSAWHLCDLGATVYFLLYNQIFFMQPFLQHRPAISDYYRGWKTLLFLTAGSRLNGLKRIFWSSCFGKAFKSVVTTAKAVCPCFGDCFSMAFVLPCSYKWEAESFFA